MRVIFTKELKMVADDLDRLSKGVHLAIDQAGKALLDSDIDTAQAVIDGDAALDKLENDILNHCVTLLAQQSPVATDLRMVVSTLRLAATFERMGDLARHIAETARRAYPPMRHRRFRPRGLRADAAVRLPRFGPADHYPGYPGRSHGGKAHHQ